MVVFIEKGGANIDPKYYNPLYGDPDKGTPNLGTPIVNANLC